jgi:cAMP-dependent protein kinase regulator
VSAESAVSKKKFVPVVIEKSEAQVKHINEIIKDNILFAHLEEAQMKIVLDAIAPGSAAPGESIITQGDLIAEQFYILDEGCCEIFKDGTLVQTVTESMSFGELALMYNAPRAATVTAKTESKLWMLDRNTFKNILMDTTMKTRKKNTDFLLNVPILASLTDFERSTVADALKKEKYLDGEVIIKEGDPGDCFHIVEEGSCVCLKAASGDKPVMEINTGSYFGEIAILMDKPRQATVVAAGEVRTLTLERKTFKVGLCMCFYSYIEIVLIHIVCVCVRVLY